MTRERVHDLFHMVLQDTWLFEGTVRDDSIASSAGQKQLLTIARAMIQGNPVLILDEATSSVDTRTERITRRAMDQLTEHRTSFVAEIDSGSHR